MLRLFWFNFSLIKTTRMFYVGCSSRHNDAILYDVARLSFFFKHPSLSVNQSNTSIIHFRALRSASSHKFQSLILVITRISKFWWVSDENILISGSKLIPSMVWWIGQRPSPFLKSFGQPAVQAQWMLRLETGPVCLTSMVFPKVLRDKQGHSMYHYTSLWYGPTGYRAPVYHIKVTTLSPKATDAVEWSSVSWIYVNASLYNVKHFLQLYVDTVGDAKKYEAKLSEIFPDIQVTVTPKADSKFPIVSAASICAKVSILTYWFPML